MYSDNLGPIAGTIDVDIRILHPVLEENQPGYSTQGSAGIDLRACMDADDVTIPPGGRHAFATGLAIDIRTPSMAGFVYSRSGLGTKEGLTVSQGVGVIDPDYRGEIIVSLLNTSDAPRTVRRGQRIAQLVFQPIHQARLRQVEALSETSRGSGGFGHTGKM
ncbi:dUTP pyrophosphatase [Desulfobaculum xiamenense]|uniref:dUTP diphosphatase n=1 Tax=Desulfobaculum xiamenense TaxID=995050 RepID=A0A846QEF4_9BACT|nr:dUTP diphosphatase [Desulfobaculum xiamenense]NJB67126.1 dUTP pyrophosphatase [Desulfobaculum xiamenense]